MFRGVKSLERKKKILSVTASENLARKMLLGMIHTAGHDTSRKPGLHLLGLAEGPREKIYSDD